MLEITELEIGLYLDFVAIVTMLGFMIISDRFRMRRTAGDRIFFIMCINVIIYICVNTSQSIVLSSNQRGFETLLLFQETAMEILILFITFEWLLFVGFWIYESADHLRRKYWPFLVPMAFLIILYVVNLFTGILFRFEYDYEYYISAKIPYLLVALVQPVYFLISGFLIWKNNRSADRMKTFHFAPVLIPFIMNFVLLLTLDVDAASIALTCGLIFIFISMTEHWQYESGIQGFYHRAFLNYIREKVRGGKENVGSVIVFKTGGDELALAGIIRDELPRDVRPIHLDRGAFAVCLGEGMDDLKDMIVMAISDAADEYDIGHPGEKIGLVTEIRERKENESAEHFLNIA